jgi:predicted short-subunit dehydrogenase-like oxidoreductase (DUF2520 family)
LARLKISIIGSGNVAWHLALAIEDAGHSICQVYSRNLQHARQLSKKLFDAQATNSLDFETSEAQIFIVAVSDSALLAVLDELYLPDHAILVHTSGNLPIDLLLQYQAQQEQALAVGVFYPLMSLSKDRKINYSSLPICIEASTQDAENELVALAQQISKIVYIIDSAERKTLHLAAVFVNNFVNHLLLQGQRLVEDAGMDFLLLKPIIKETLEKALVAEDIADGQTGPARRGDQQVMKNQLQMLKNQPFLEKIYRVMSESIFEEYNLK